MTHKLISIHKAAKWLNVPVGEVESYVRKGWLRPDVPCEYSYFDAKKVTSLKKRLARERKRARWKWSVIGVLTGLAVAGVYLARAGGERGDKPGDE